MLFSFFANNSRMKQPTPVFLSYMNFPYAIEGGSTKKFLGVLNKLCTAKREAILTTFVKTNVGLPWCFKYFLSSKYLYLQMC